MAVWAPVKSVLRGYSQSEASSLSVSERRKRIAKRVAYVVRAIYLGVQLVCLVILLQSDSTLGKSWRSQNASYAWSFLALLTCNFGLYAALCSSNPGYLPVKAADAEEVPLNTDAAATAGPDRLSDPEIHVDATTGYGPLPYPTDYANYINLSALGRGSADAPSSALPWWELPNPGVLAVLRSRTP